MLPAIIIPLALLSGVGGPRALLLLTSVAEECSFPVGVLDEFPKTLDAPDVGGVLLLLVVVVWWVRIVPRLPPPNGVEPR